MLKCNNYISAYTNQKTNEIGFLDLYSYLKELIESKTNNKEIQKKESLKSIPLIRMWPACWLISILCKEKTAMHSIILKS